MTAPLASPIGERDVRLGGRWTGPQRAKNDAIFVAARAALALALALPRPATRAACAALGDLTFALWARGRRRVERNLEAALGPEAPPARAVFRGMGSLLSDMLDLLRGEPASLGSLSLLEGDRQTLERAMASGRGVVLATGHLGPWERLGALLVEEGFPLATVARRSYDPRFDALYARLRQSRGLEVLYRGDAGFAKGLVRALRSGKIVGFPMDLGGRGVRVHPSPWPGGPLPLAIGPAELALRTGASVVVATPSPAERGRLSIGIEAISAHDLLSGPRGAEQLTERIGEALGRRVRALPTLWPWMHADLPAAFSSATTMLRPGQGHR